MVVGEVAEVALVQAILDIRNKQVFFVSLNPQIKPAQFKNQKTPHRKHVTRCMATGYPPGDFVSILPTNPIHNYLLTLFHS